MKKLVSLILCLAMALAWLPAGSPLVSAADSSPFAGGSGTADDPYLVSTPEQLKAVADYPESCFLQIADINLNTGYSLSGAADLKGTYDGGGHRIIGYQGAIHNGYSIFRYNYGTIRNLGLFACRIAIETRFSDNVFPDKSMGLLTIYNYGTIENCYIEDTHTTIKLNNNIKWETDAPEMDIGGFSAVNTGTIRNCYVTGYIWVYSDFYYVSPGRSIDMREGGITAINGETGRVENCFVSCSTSDFISSDIEGTRWVGLFCGENNGTVTSCCFDSSGSTTNDHGTGTYDVQKKTGAEAAEYLNQQNGGIPYWGWGSSTDNDEPVLNYRELGASSSLPSGVYDLPVTDVVLSLNLPNENAELYYEIKGSGEGKQPYTQPLTITGETELFVYGQHKDSDKIYQVTYYHYWDRPSPVTATPEERVQSQPVEVELSAASEGAKIWYTLDGTDPTESGSRLNYELNGPIRIRKRTTITAVAEVDGIYGPVERFEYVISPPITASPQAGVQTEPIEVELECEPEDYDIYYTTDGSDPTQYGTEYTKPIPIFQTTDLKVVPKIDDQFGEVTTFHYEYSKAVITPSVPAGKYDGVQRLTLSCSPDYLDLYYTLDNGQQLHYQGETIHIYQTTTLTVYAKYQGQTVASQTFRYELPALEITADPIQGTYAEIKTITLTSNPDDYALFYTLDGSDPADNGIRYQQPFELDHSATVRVCAKYGIKVVEGGPFSFEYTMDLPYVIAKTEPGASRAPLRVELEVSEGGYDIYYTLDGSDPKDSDIKYEGPFWINEPVTTVVRAVPKDKYFSDYYGTTSQFCYTFPYQTFTVEKEKAEKHTDYELTLTVSNTLPEGKKVTFYAAAYLNGRMLGVAAEQAELPEGTENKSVTISYPYDGLLPDDAEFKVFCLDSKTRRPYCEPLTYAVSEVEVFQELASISVSPNPIVGQVGETVARPTVTAHYTNGKPDSVVSMNIKITPDYDVVTVSVPSQNLLIKREGTGSITVSYSEDGITKSIEVPVTGVAPVANLGFLANPTADPLPEDAIPIYTAQELAAIGGAESAGKTYYLADDIRLTGEWEPIYNFRGTLDGRGHKVSGLYISSSSEKQLAGLFASAYDAVIKNLAVEVASQGISTSYSGGFDGTYAGALVADSNNTTFSNCYTTGGPVTARGIAPIAGGLVGYLDNSAAERVENCFSTCQVTAESPQAKSNTCKAGGLIGELKSDSQDETAVVSRCYATGNVSVSHPGGGSGSAGTQAGGLVGSGSRMEISNCFALGDVTVRRTDTSTSSSVYAGGLGGWLSETTLDQCYAAGDVFGGSNSYVGGLTARAVSGSFTCYRVGQSVTGTTYYNGGDSVYMPPTQSSFPEFDFTTTWEITEGAFQGLPHLKYHR